MELEEFLNNFVFHTKVFATAAETDLSGHKRQRLEDDSELLKGSHTA
jgi:hypothetical protein